MPMFRYKAVNNIGETMEGSFNSGDRNQLLRMIREKHYYPVKVEEIVSRKDKDILAFLQKVNIKSIAIFCRQFYTMLNAGITVIQCLDILQVQTENKKLKIALTNVYESVQKGELLSAAMSSHLDVFPEILINLVESGEVSGTLDLIMQRMAYHFEKENKIKNKIKSAMIYPIILSILSVLVVTFLLTFVMPTFLGMFESGGVELPGPTKILLGLSGFLVNFWYIVILVIAVSFYVFRKYKNTDKGRLAIDKLKLRIPILKEVVVKISTARFTRTLSSLLGSGIQLLHAMEVAAKVVGNSVAAAGILMARDEMRKGMNLSVPIRKMNFFPPMVDSMITIGEESGTLDEVLEKTADFYDDEVETSTQRLVAIMEPLLIVVMAFVIGFIVVAMALPMFDMLKAVK